MKTVTVLLTRYSDLFGKVICTISKYSYSHASISVDDEEEICVGIFRGVDNGENLEITGEYVEHPSYGFQFKANSFKVVEPDDLLSMERYLGSGAIKGVGEALAKRIVKRFGKDTSVLLKKSRSVWLKSKESVSGSHSRLQIR